MSYLVGTPGAIAIVVIFNYVQTFETDHRDGRGRMAAGGSVRPR